MANLNILDLNGKEKEKFEIADHIVKQPLNNTILHQEIKRYLATGRAGTHKTKQRSEVSGGGRKPWRQKGTGNARAGSNRSPIWRHGGITFGPTPRDHSFKLNKKVIRKSRLVAISEKFKNKKIIVIDELKFDKPSTKRAQGIIDKLNIAGSKILLVLVDSESGAGKSFRNIPGLNITGYRGVNTYDVLVADYLMFTKKSLTDFIKGLNNEGS